jgi:hypothetical protein
MQTAENRAACIASIDHVTPPQLSEPQGSWQHFMVNPASKIHLVVFTSEYTGNSETIATDLACIVKSAKRNNENRNLTGVIFYHHGRFMEFIEGEAKDVRSLIARISHDRRHRNIQFLFNEPIQERGFEHWHLDIFNLAEDEPLNIDILKVIGTAYRKNFVTASDMLLEVYKSFLENHVVA